MLRIRKKNESYEVNISYTTTCPIAELNVCIADINIDICDYLNKLVVNADAFDEVRIDNKGALHCKNIAAEPTPESEDDS